MLGNLLKIYKKKNEHRADMNMRDGRTIKFF